ncbi:hypothetical protein EGW08_017638 [Elysia chlorotica]|uniref:Uncharacterized protein n=1 Tax=Elysia chlorotica TaxID=188477 RepID=A0A3S1H918_ELYCH|nr:hypothetical protein EGW08_017638 [Elysia chlorotica]
MSGPDPQWRERCDRYFSSMVDAHYTENNGAKSHTKGKNKKRRKEKKYKVTKENGYRRFDKGPVQFPSQHARHHVTTFTSKAEPLKGPIRWLSVLDLHGTSMLLRGRSVLFCLFWTIASVLALSVFGVFVFIFVSDYFDDATVFKVKMAQESMTPSPLSLVLCNANLLRMSSVSPGSRFYGLRNITVSDQVSTQTVFTQSPSDLLDRKELKEFLELAGQKSDELPLSDLQAEFGLYSAMVSDSDWDAVASAALRVNSNPFPEALRMTASEMRSFGTDMKSDVLRCTKNGRQCDSG